MTPERRLLIAVVRRAFEDIKVIIDYPSDEIGCDALRWIQGRSEILTAEDEFMCFENICSLLRLPYHTLVAYSYAVKEGRHAEFIRNATGVAPVRDELQVIADSDFATLLHGSSCSAWFVPFCSTEN